MGKTVELSLANYLDMVKGSALNLVEVSALLLCLSLWINRKRPRAVLDALRAKSIRFNLIVAAIDMATILLPLAAIATVVTGFVNRHGLTLFSHMEAKGITYFVIGFAAVFVGDFAAYWRHRLEHYGWFWKSHVMHHSDRQLNWTTVYRFHPINRLTTVLIDGGALALIGFPAWAIVLNGFVRHYYGIFVHINQPWTLGWAGNILVSPAMHRWHHVLEGQGVGKNFASVFSIFDRVFGTRYCPGPCTVPLGVEGVGDGQMLEQYALPFRRAG